jgi:phosphoglucomutase
MLRGKAVQCCLCHSLLLLLPLLLLQEHPGSTVVTDSVTSNGLTTFIEQRGGKHFR